MYVKGGHFPDPYRLDVAYAGGQPVGTVEKIVMDEPNSDRLGPCIRRALRGKSSVELRELNSEAAGKMSDWPSSPLIRITSGSLWGRVPLQGALAASAGLAASGTSFKYQIIQGPGVGQLIRRDVPDSGSILSWEDVVPVPADDLRRLQGEFRGAAISERCLSALLKVTSALNPPSW